MRWRCARSPEAVAPKFEMPATPTPTPQERLALSRKAIIKHMNRHHWENDLEPDNELDDSRQPNSVSQGALGLVKHALRVWWHGHPASSMVQLARPFLGEYAKLHPFKLLGVSAGLGAAAVLVRPWRMVSVGGLLLATLKSSGLSSALLSLLTNRSQHPQNNSGTP